MANCSFSLNFLLQDKAKNTLLSYHTDLRHWKMCTVLWKAKQMICLNVIMTAQRKMKESEVTGKINCRKSEDCGRNFIEGNRSAYSSQDILFNAKPSSRLLKKKWSHSFLQEISIFEAHVLLYFLALWFLDADSLWYSLWLDDIPIILPFKDHSCMVNVSRNMEMGGGFEHASSCWSSVCFSVHACTAAILESSVSPWTDSCSK